MNEKPENKNLDSTPAPVPYAVFECAIAHVGENNKRLFRIVIALIIALILTNAAWLWAWLQYDYVSETVTVESTATGHANYIGTSGDIYNGESHSPQEETNPEG